MRDPTRRELMKLSASFAARAKTIRRTTKDETLANLYDVASRVALEKARRLTDQTDSALTAVSKLSAV